MDITTIGLDLAKNVFQIHCIDEKGEVIIRRRLRRAQVVAFFNGLKPCLIGMEACATAHFWARELVTLGHEVKIIPPSYVNRYFPDSIRIVANRRRTRPPMEGISLCGHSAAPI